MAISKLRGRVRDFAESLCRGCDADEVQDMLDGDPDVEDMQVFDLTPNQWRRGCEAAFEELQDEEDEDLDDEEDDIEG